MYIKTKIEKLSRTCSHATFGSGLPEYPWGQRQLNPGLVFSQTALGPHGLLKISHSLISKHNQYGKTKISKPNL